MTNQKFLDPLYGPISLDERSRRLAFSPEFQRLRYVRLCNINSLYLMGASEPKRFEHCVGVYHLAALWTRARRLSQRDGNVVRAAALLHDLQTGPFGHSFQYVMEDNPFDQQFEHANISSGVRNQFLQLARAGAHFSGRPFEVADLLGDCAEEVFAAIQGEGPFGPIISGTLDLDNLDNVVRLAFHMGLCSDADRALPSSLAPLLEPIDGGLGAPAKAQSLIENWFNIRKRLYEYLLLDRGEFAAKTMLTLAVELATNSGLLGPDDWRLTDEGLLDALHDRSVGENQTIGQIVKRLRVGNLFECIGVWQTKDTESYKRLADAGSKRELEQLIDYKLSKGAGPRLRVCLHYILDIRKTCRSLSYRDLRTGHVKTVGFDSQTLLVGAFITNSRSSLLTAHEQQRAKLAVETGLESVGLAERRPAPEPLAIVGERELFNV